MRPLLRANLDRQGTWLSAPGVVNGRVPGSMAEVSESGLLLTLRWREMDSNFQFRARRAGVLKGLYRRRPSKVLAFPPKRPVSCTRDRWFESVSLQQRVRVSREFAFPASPDQNGRVEFAPDSPLERIGFEPSVSATDDAVEIIVSYSAFLVRPENSNSFTGRGPAVRIPFAQPTAGLWLCVQVGISACRPSSRSFLRLLTRRLEECPAAIADHPVARAGGIAGIAQVEPDDAHAAAFCGGEQPAHRNPAASALRPETTRVEALNCGGGVAVCRLTRAIVEIVREIGRDDDQGFGPSPDSVEQGYNRFRRSIAGDDRDQGKLIERHLQEW